MYIWWPGRGAPLEPGIRIRIRPNLYYMIILPDPDSFEPALWCNNFIGSEFKCSNCFISLCSLLWNQCCGFGMIYSGSGFCFEFYEFRIQAKVNTLNSVKKENTIICHFHFILQYTQFRIHREITVLSICSFMFCWIRIRNNNFGSGCRQKFRIRIHNTGL